MPKKTSEQEKHIKAAAVRSRERALQEERLGLAAIASAVCREVPNPDRLLARLEAMTRKAQQNPKTPMRVKQSLLDGTALIRNAINRELGKPQELLDPPGWRHVSPTAVNRLVKDGEVTQQLGLEAKETLEDVAVATREQAATIAAVHEVIVRILKEGPATDSELYWRYMQQTDAPKHSAQELRRRRLELYKSGRVNDSGLRDGKDIRWVLVEDKHKIPESERTWKRGGKTEERVKCPECGEMVGKGAGIAVHIKAKHSTTGFIRRG